MATSRNCSHARGKTAHLNREGAVRGRAVPELTETVVTPAQCRTIGKRTAVVLTSLNSCNPGTQATNLYARALCIVLVTLPSGNRRCRRNGRYRSSRSTTRLLHTAATRAPSAAKTRFGSARHNNASCRFTSNALRQRID
jgi:hypothetical protein